MYDTVKNVKRFFLSFFLSGARRLLWKLDYAMPITLCGSPATLDTRCSRSEVIAIETHINSAISSEMNFIHSDVDGMTP